MVPEKTAFLAYWGEKSVDAGGMAVIIDVRIVVDGDVAEKTCVAMPVLMPVLMPLPLLLLLLLAWTTMQEILVLILLILLPPAPEWDRRCSFSLDCSKLTATSWLCYSIITIYL